ncbi:MAG: putative thymidylate kinase [Candidatus Roizmanbacteria bacterium GW2011_GWA2_35_19]|uniref:Thymidylate kinase n=1 Tax=Candidatus Roizmanbacteria bacterium GW2011_GWA2_35_19 TaxID=1618478 RepID=A0A0G0BRT9_9BACT|nr:MAG: putative thymidylate kinase [Candidatus Roizmanbacteria bacterium GW2011_GWA2_35_19]
MKNMFIVIEGIDGAGCETQGKRLLNMINHHSGERGDGKLTSDARMTATLIKYPDYERNVGKIIREFLYQNKDLTAEQQFLLYTMQFIMDKKMIAERRKDEILIADRYFSTTLCYQTLEGIDMTMALDYAKNFQIEVPDAVFYLNVDPDIAIKRKHGEDKEKNFREKDFDFIRKTHKKYQELVDQQVWTKWVNIDGNKAVEEVTKAIYNVITNIK